MVNQRIYQKGVGIHFMKKKGKNKREYAEIPNAKNSRNSIIMKLNGYLHSNGYQQIEIIYT